MTNWLIQCKGNIFLAVTGLPWIKKVSSGYSLSCVKEYFPGHYWLALDKESSFWL
jgi:hypothetical protein